MRQHSPAEACTPKPEKPSCRTCAHRQRCHGTAPEVTRETVLQLIREATVEVVTEWEARKR